jgi:hypothetical protein
MAKTLWWSVMTVCLAVAFGTSGSTPAGATSCVVHPDGSPAAIAAGTERLATEMGFFDLYDFALLGTVSEIHTIPTDGATTITVDVVAVLGAGDALQQVKIWARDPGWMWGYPFEVGTSYFIPVQRTGPEGQANISFVCDPISVVDLGIEAELRQLAAVAGITFTTVQGDWPLAPESETVGDEARDAHGTPQSGISSALVALGLGITSAVVAVLVMLRRAAFQSRRRCVARWLRPPHEP